MGSRRTEEAVASLHHGVDTLWCQGLPHTFTGRDGLGSRLIFRALRPLPRAHRRPHDARGPLVRRLDLRGRQKAPQVAPVRLPTAAGAPTVMVWSGQETGAQLGRAGRPQRLGRRGPVGPCPGRPRTPPRHSVLHHPCAPLPTVPSPACLRRPDVAARPPEMGQTFVLGDLVAGGRVVAAPAVCSPPPVVVRGPPLLHVLSALRGAALRAGGPVGLERPQVGGRAPDAPARVIRVYDGLGGSRGPPSRGGRADRVGDARPGLWRAGPWRPCPPGQNLPDHGDLAHGHANPVGQPVCRCHGPRPPPRRGRPVLLRRPVRRRPAPLFPPPGAPAHRHPVWRHLRSREGEHRCRGGTSNALRCPRPATVGARVERHWHVHQGGGELRRPGRRAGAAGAGARLPSRTLGVGDACPLGKRGSLALCAPPEPLQRDVSGRMARSQSGSLALQCGTQGQQRLATPCWRILGWRHSAYWRPGRDGPQAANQLQLYY